MSDTSNLRLLGWLSVPAVLFVLFVSGWAIGCRSIGGRIVSDAAANVWRCERPAEVRP